MCKHSRLCSRLYIGWLFMQAAEEDAAAGSRKGASLPHAILLAAAMSVENPFLHSAGHGGGTAAASAEGAAGSRNKDAGGCSRK